MLEFTEFLSRVMEVLQTAEGRRGLLMWAAVCLLLYVYHRYHIGRLRQQRQALSERLATSDSQLLALQESFAVARDENHLLRILLALPSLQKAADFVLKKYVPHPRDGLGALLQVLGDEQRVLFSRGVSERTLERWHIPESLLSRLSEEPVMHLEGRALQESELLWTMSARDRGKLRRLFIAASNRQGRPSCVLITSGFLPKNADAEAQKELAARVVRFLERRLHLERCLEIQKNQLRLTSDMLQLRSVAEHTDEPPTALIEEYLSRLMHLLQADRMAVFLKGASDGTGSRVIRCGRELSASERTLWRQHEDRLLDRLRTRGKLTTLALADLHELGITSLIGSALVVPLRREERVVAHLCCTRRSSDVFAEPDQDLAAWAGEDLTSVMHRSFSHFFATCLAKTDALTELANRREFDRHLRLATQRRPSETFPVSLLLLDLDRFKRINDTYGHQAGDFVLRETSRRLRSEIGQLLRGGDSFLIARYGGEELAVLLYHVPEAGAIRIAESLRAGIAAAPFRFRELAIPVTASIGVASCPQHVTGVEELLAAADKALYAAKETGRNRVQCASAQGAGEALLAEHG